MLYTYIYIYIIPYIMITVRQTTSWTSDSGHYYQSRKALTEQLLKAASVRPETVELDLEWTEVTELL